MGTSTDKDSKTNKTSKVGEKRAVIFFADGIEECEALIVLDVLNRAGVDAKSAAIGDKLDVESNHGVVIRADVLAKDIDFNKVDLVVLPGGVPGWKNLHDSPIVKEQCTRFAALANDGKMVAAICASPSVLGLYGLLDGVKATCHSGFEENLKGAELVDAGVVADGNVVTGRALGAAFPFAYKLVEKLLGPAAVAESKAKIFLD